MPTQSEEQYDDFDPNDFKRDDFANDKGILKQRKEQQELADKYAACLKHICNGLKLEKLAKMHEEDMFDPSDFALLQDWDLELLEDLFASTDAQRQLYLVEIDEVDFMIIFKTRKIYPRTFIYREGFKEKLVNFFQRQDVDFRDAPRFSKNFHVVTSNKDQLYMNLYNKPLEELADFSNVEIELNQNHCIISHHRSGLYMEDAEELIQIAKAAHRVFGF